MGESSRRPRSPPRGLSAPKSTHAPHGSHPPPRSHAHLGSHSPPSSHAPPRSHARFSSHPPPSSHAPHSKHSPHHPSHSPHPPSHHSGRKKTKIKKMADKSKETVLLVGEKSKNITMNLCLMFMMYPVRWITICIREIFTGYTKFFQCLPSVNSFCFGQSLKMGCIVIGLCIICRCAYILYWLVILTWCIPRNMAIIALCWQYVYTGYELFMVVLTFIFLKFVLFSHKPHISTLWMLYAGFLDSLASLLLAVSWMAAMQFGRPYLRHKYKLPCKFPRQVVVTAFIWSFIWVYFIIVIESYRREKEAEAKLAMQLVEEGA